MLSRWKSYSIIVLSFLVITCSGGLIKDGSWNESSVGRVMNLEQGWTEWLQQAFYFTTQGSQILPYKWFLVLEQASDKTLLRDDAYMERMRYIPSRPSSRWNPDGLPVGFAKDVDSDGKEWVGLTCAACHTTQIAYTNPETKKNTLMRIDGGPALADFNQFNFDLVAALQATQKDEQKFSRFASRVLGGDDIAANRIQLKKELIVQTARLDKRNKINDPAGVEHGYGRLDAIGAIFNQVMVVNSHMDENIRPSSAPVSYPFLWGTHQSDFVQWTGFAPNMPEGMGPLVRNGGEVIGVYGKIDISASSKTYDSSLRIKELVRLEEWVKKLRSPRWPENVLPRIDQEKAARGEVLYAQNCASCHQVIARKDEGKLYKSVLVPVSSVGTDPAELDNMNRVLAAGPYAGKKRGVIAGAEIESRTTGLDPLVNSVTGALFHQPVTLAEALLLDKGADFVDDVGDLFKRGYKRVTSVTSRSVSSTETSSAGKYKSRPLNGIWATAPYLHNGSVANLYELMLPVGERSKSFNVGSREFDPKHVGFVMEQEAQGDFQPFLFNTEIPAKPGNLNSGHEYGLELTERQRWELVEYMKTL